MSMSNSFQCVYIVSVCVHCLHLYCHNNEDSLVISDGFPPVRAHISFTTFSKGSATSQQPASIYMCAVWESYRGHKELYS